MLLQHNSHTAQQQELESLVEAYQRQIKRSKDQNDEALARMKNMKKRWKPEPSSSSSDPPQIGHPKPKPRPRNSLTGCSPTPRLLPNILSELPNDPDLSLTEVQEASRQMAHQSTTSSLYHEMKASWGS